MDGDVVTGWMLAVLLGGCCLCYLVDVGDFTGRMVTLLGGRWCSYWVDVDVTVCVLTFY